MKMYTSYWTWNIAASYSMWSFTRGWCYFPLTWCWRFDWDFLFSNWAMKKTFLLSIESWLFKDGILKLWFMKYIIINPHITGLVEFLRMYTQQATKTGPFLNCWALALAPWKPVEVINNVSNSHISSPGGDPYLRPQLVTWSPLPQRS